MSSQQIVLGLSPGRTGSKSISYILSQQKDCYSVHEPAPKLPYKKNLDLFNEHIEGVLKSSKNSKYVCFNGFFYTWYVDEFIKMFPETKVYVLSRNINDTVESHYKKVTKYLKNGNLLYKNYWNDKDRARCKSDWDICFPNVGKGMTLREGIREYLIFYCVVIKKLIEKYKDQVRIYEIESLNNNKNLITMMEFIGIDKSDMYLPESKVQVSNRWFEINPNKGGKRIEFNRAGS